MIEGLTAFWGRENVSGISLQRLETDKFGVVRLLGKLANTCADLPTDHLASTSTFKAVTGGDRMTGERKFQGSFEFTPFARLVFSTNHYPQSKDASQAFFRRWLVIPFDVAIEKHERIDNLAALLADSSELSGLLNQALAVLPLMREGGGFSQSESTQAAMHEFRQMSDPLAAWLDKMTVLQPVGMVSKKDLSISYNAACEATGRPMMSAKAFYAAVRRCRPTIQEAQRTIYGEVKDVFLGLAMVPKTSQTDPSASTDSVHSVHFSQISLEREEVEERERVKT